MQLTITLLSGLSLLPPALSNPLQINVVIPSVISHASASLPDNAAALSLPDALDHVIDYPFALRAITPGGGNGPDDKALFVDYWPPRIYAPRLALMEEFPDRKPIFRIDDGSLIFESQPVEVQSNGMLTTSLPSEMGVKWAAVPWEDGDGMLLAPVVKGKVLSPGKLSPHHRKICHRLSRTLAKNNLHVAFRPDNFRSASVLYICIPGVEDPACPGKLDEKRMRKID
jgi:hypothetical protein